jgi:hypothetical protein
MKKISAWYSSRGVIGAQLNANTARTVVFRATIRHSGMVRQHQIRNLEIPGSMLRIAPE